MTGARYLLAGIILLALYLVAAQACEVPYC